MYVERCMLMMYTVTDRYIRACNIKMTAVRINVIAQRITEQNTTSEEVTIVRTIAEEQSYVCRNDRLCNHP